MSANKLRAALTLAVVALIGACAVPEGDGANGGIAAAGQPDRYQVRGVVRSVAEGSLHIRHQAIPEFRDSSGEVVGMQAMSMDFALGEGVSSDGVAAGDKVAFELEIDWRADQPARITALEVLPPETRLDF